MSRPVCRACMPIRNLNAQKGEQRCLFPLRTPDALVGVHPSLLLFFWFGSAFYTIATLYNDKHTETLRQSNRKKQYSLIIVPIVFTESRRRRLTDAVTTSYRSDLAVLSPRPSPSPDFPLMNNDLTIKTINGRVSLHT